MFDSGRGESAARKVEGLLRTGARVTVISPEATEAIQRLAHDGKLGLHMRPYQRGDLRGYFLAYTATGAPEVDKEMAEEARSEGVLLNVVDRPELCNFISPATSL